MNYEVERELSKKVDEWQFRALEQKYYALERENNELQTKIGNIEAKLSNWYRTIDSILITLAENENFSEQQNDLYTLRQYL